MANDPSGDDGFLSRWSRRKLQNPTATPAESTDDGTRDTPGAVHNAAGDDAKASDAAADADDGQAAHADEGGGPTAEENAAEAAEPFDDVDFDALDFQSDYTRFMGDNVPDAVRNKALDKLWSSDPILANVDGLTDYSDDFTDAALAVPLGTLKTAYRVGRGFLTDEEVAEWDRLGRPDPDPAAQDSDAVAEAAAGAGHVAAAGIAIAIEPASQPDVAAMFAASDAYHAALYPAESNHPVAPEALAAVGAVMLVARDSDGRALGCGAVLCQPSGDGEIKRMWVQPDARGHGVGRQLLRALIDEAGRRQVRVLRLETGPHQEEALGLYRAFGFEDCSPFPPYRPDQNSVFMERKIEAPDRDTSEQA
ncbi:MAG: GNAT family N-acetyltransferase [Pseudomonadota bacterium]